MNMMREAIKNFPKQFSFDPQVENRKKLGSFKKFIVCGMGGSHLAADLIKAWKSSLDIIVHSDYGLPALPDSALKNRLVIISSYSGNTEEAIDSFNEAKKMDLSLAALSIGGRLLELAKKSKCPYVQIPDTNIQPRAALGFMARALFALIGEREGMELTRDLPISLDSVLSDCENQGHALSVKLKNHVPLIYASAKNKSLAYIWKIKFNETGKIPAFMNVFPELNHNEMTGFSAEGGSASGGDIPKEYRDLSKKFSFILIKDPSDRKRILKRMEILEKLMEKRGFDVFVSKLAGVNWFHKIFSSLLIADWAGFYTARIYGAEANEVPMVEEFKKLMKR